MCLFLECALFGMLSFWNVPFLECASSGMCSLECAFLGICPFWNVPFLECALFGMGSFWNCLIWNKPLLECAFFGMCPFWNVPFLEYAFFGICKNYELRISEAMHKLRKYQRFPNLNSFEPPYFCSVKCVLQVDEYQFVGPPL